MSEENGSKRAGRNRSRRDVIKATGVALGAGATGIGVFTGKSTATGTISADDVDPADDESAEEFYLRTLELGETEGVVSAYENLSDEQLEAVRRAADRLTTYEIETVDSTNLRSPSASTDDISVSPTAIPVSSTEEFRRQVAGVTVTKTTHTVSFEINTSGDTISNCSHSSSGSAPASLWHHNGLYDSFYQVQNGSTEFYSRRAHEYTHSVGGQTIINEAVAIYQKGDSSGTELLEKTKYDV